ncbi:hypothetical protein [Janthinobacterium sp. OK676]|uniref:hypothetical protein n=1 Tax=Janthinobacterium sp. OK676 TaxID=1855295 RepID=UPI0011141EAE|nr:hypothetical protein [Janthinobacterium sp. OK676]
MVALDDQHHLLLGVGNGKGERGRALQVVAPVLPELSAVKTVSQVEAQLLWKVKDLHTPDLTDILPD